MQKLTIKNQRIDEGRPIICVPVVEREKEKVVQEVRSLVEKQTEMIEWRADWYENVNDLAEVGSILAELKPLVRDTILLVTFRSKAQGGEREITEEEREAFYCLVAESGAADMVDVELFEIDRAEHLIGTLQRKGTRVIVSHHNFHETPEDEEMLRILERMAESGADIVKLAVMPECAEDVLRLLSVTHQFKKTHPQLPVVTMSMGSCGVISRVSGEVFGSCITFGSHEKPSAPGQLQMDTLAQILDALHETGER